MPYSSRPVGRAGQLIHCNLYACGRLNRPGSLVLYRCVCVRVCVRVPEVLGTMQAQLSLPSLSAAMPARSLSRTDFVRSIADIEVKDTLVRDVERQRASSVMERQYPAAQSYYTTMLELKEAYEREEAERERSRCLGRKGLTNKVK